MRTIVGSTLCRSPLHPVSVAPRSLPCLIQPFSAAKSGVPTSSVRGIFKNPSAAPHAVKLGVVVIDPALKFVAPPMVAFPDREPRKGWRTGRGGRRWRWRRVYAEMDGRALVGCNRDGCRVKGWRKCGATKVHQLLAIPYVKTRPWVIAWEKRHADGLAPAWIVSSRWRGLLHRQIVTLALIHPQTRGPGLVVTIPLDAARSKFGQAGICARGRGRRRRRVRWRKRRRAWPRHRWYWWG